MKKMIAGLFGAALLSGVAFADVGAPTPSAKDLSKMVEKVNYVETDVAGVRLNGYVDVGYIYNFTGDPVSQRVGTDGANGGSFLVNAVKLTIDKPLNNKNEWQAGFRTDLMFGRDAGTLNGNWWSSSASELFLEQAYVNFRAPIGNGLDIKAGKFTTWLGYEVIERPANLNITYGQMYTYLPSTMTGLALEYPLCNTADVGFAIGNASGDWNLDDRYAVMGTLNLKVPGGNANWRNSVYYIWDSFYDTATNDHGNSVIYDTNVNWAPKFTNGKLLLGAAFDLGYAQNTFGGVNRGSTIIGAAGYAKYQFTSIFSLAGRVDYVHVDDPMAFNSLNVWASNFGGAPAARDGWSATLTAGFNVVENLLIRAEYRMDIGNNVTIDDGDVAHTFAVQAVYTF